MGQSILTGNPVFYCLHAIAQKPAHVAEWSTHSASICSRAWRAQWPRFASKPGHVRLPKNYL